MDSKTKWPKAMVRWFVSYGIAAACLYWVFHDISLRELLQPLYEVHWWMIALAVVLDLLVYVCGAWVWQLLLRPVGKVSIARATQAVFAGRFANDILPVHVGYVVRVFLMSRWLQTKFTSVVPSLLVERLLDGIWLALGIGIAAIFFPLPAKISEVAELWAGIIVFGLLVGAWIVFRKRGTAEQKSHGLGRSKWVQKLRQSSAHMLEEVRTIGRSHVLVVALAVSLLKFVVQCLAFLVVLWAYGFHFPIEVQVAIFVLAYVGMSIPSTPASVGVFQVFCIAGLEVFHVAKPVATAFSLLAFVVLTLPLSIAGFIALGQSGITLKQIRVEANAWRERAR
ncbi:MAG: lysylphosphatidylglycerol synthase transmembrane domain-containing protein [Limisphaerales bacterium]